MVWLEFGTGCYPYVWHNVWQSRKDLVHILNASFAQAPNFNVAKMMCHFLLLKKMRAVLNPHPWTFSLSDLQYISYTKCKQTKIRKCSFQYCVHISCLNLFIKFHKSDVFSLLILQHALKGQIVNNKLCLLQYNKQCACVLGHCYK